MERAPSARPRSLGSSSSGLSVTTREEDSFHLPPEEFAPSFRDFIKSTAPSPPFVHAVPPTPHALRRVSSHRFASSFPNVTTTDAADHQPLGLRSPLQSGTSSNSELLRPVDFQGRRFSLLRTQTYPPRKPSMASDQYSPMTRSRAASVSSCYSKHMVGTQSETSFAPSFHRPPAADYNCDEFSPTAAVFQDIPRRSFCEPVSPMLPAGDSAVRIKHPLLPHEHVAKYKQRVGELDPRRDLRLKTSGYSTPASGSQAARSPAYGTPVNESTPSFNGSPGPTYEDPPIKYRQDSSASRSFYGDLNAAPTPLSSTSGPISRSVSSSHARSRYNTLRALNGLQLRERSNSQSSSTKSSQRKEEDEALVRNSVISEVSDFRQKLNETSGGLESHKMPLPHEPWKDPSHRLSYETSKRTSFIDRVRSVRSRGSLRTSKSSYTSPSTFGSYVTHEEESPLPQSPTSTVTSPTVQSPNSLPAIESKTSLNHFEASTPNSASPTTLTSPTGSRCVSDSRVLEAKALETKVPSKDGKKKFLGLRHTPSILKHRNKRGTGEEQEEGKASNVSSPQSASSSTPVSPLGSSGPFTSGPKPKLQKKSSKMKLQISAPLPGSMTSGRPLEPNSKSWLERREEAKREKTREDLKKKIKKVP